MKMMKMMMKKMMDILGEKMPLLVIELDNEEFVFLTSVHFTEECFDEFWDYRMFLS